MKRDLGFLGGSDQDGHPSGLGDVVRDADFVDGWDKVESFGLDETTWGTEMDVVDGPLHMFYSFSRAVARDIPGTKLEAEEPTLWEFLRRTGHPLYDADPEALSPWLQELTELWPRGLGVQFSAYTYYRDGDGSFWKIQRQELKIVLPCPRISDEGDIADNDLPQLGDIAANSWEELMEGLRRVAQERGWTQPLLLVPWYYQRGTGTEAQGVENILIVDKIRLIRDAKALAELRQMRQAIEGDAAQCQYEVEAPRTPIFAVDLVAYDVREVPAR